MMNEILCDLKVSQAFLDNEAAVTSVAEAICACLREGDAVTLKKFLDQHEPADIAALLDRLEAVDALAAIRHVGLGDRALIYGYMSQARQLALSEMMTRRELAAMVSHMSHDDRADLFKQLDDEAQDALLPALAQAERDDLRRLASYPEGSAGSVMTSDYATLSPGMSAPEGLDALRKQALSSETVYRSYIVDEERRLVGALDLRDLLVARSTERVRDLMDTEPVFISVDEPSEEAAQLISRYDLIALPVVDGDGRLVGIVTQDDAMDVQQAEATEDFHRSGTVLSLPSGLRDAGVFLLYRARVSWLVVLVFGNVLSGAGLAFYEDTISSYVALVFFLPLLIGSGGNAGAQSATLMVRALATGDVRPRDWGWMLGREVLIALLLGLTMAAAVSLIGVARAGVDVTIVVSLSMVAIVLLGCVVGMSLPFVFTRVGIDPATASAPLVTSIADVVGVLVYFGIATRMLMGGA
jgi:magnesium transporter